jgi:hypothetical protein
VGSCVGVKRVLAWSVSGGIVEETGIENSRAWENREKMEDVGSDLDLLVTGLHIRNNIQLAMDLLECFLELTRAGRH